MSEREEKKQQLKETISELEQKKKETEENLKMLDGVIHLGNMMLDTLEAMDEDEKADD